MSSLKNVDFEIIRYANCWEDADLLIKVLNPEKESKIISIGSAGDNSFSLLVNDPSLLVAVDVSQVQIHLIELKKIAIKNLSREEFLRFAGFDSPADDTERWNIYISFRNQLPMATTDYWNKNKDSISEGIINGGKFEKYFKLFSNKVLPFIHSQKTIDELVSRKASKDQETFYENIWNNLKWKFLFKIFFSKRLMGLLGRDPVFLKQVDISVGEFIYNKAQNHLRSVHAQNNYILDYALKGSFENNLPHYVRAENYYKIQKNIDKLVCQVGFLETAFDKYGTFNCFNLSNIFEYLDQDQFDELKIQIANRATQGAKIAYWNLMVDRVLSQNNEILESVNLKNEDLQTDKGFFYKNFQLDRKVA